MAGSPSFLDPPGHPWHLLGTFPVWASEQEQEGSVLLELLRGMKERGASGVLSAPVLANDLALWAGGREH